MMTATATPKTIRVLKNQLPEITKWRNLISPPLRRKVVTIVPPPEVLSSKVEVLLAPFIHDMRINQTPYLILVRGNNFQLFPLCILNFFPLLISRHKQKNRIYLNLLKTVNDCRKEQRQIAFYHRNTNQGRKEQILSDLKLPLTSEDKKILCVVATVSLGMNIFINLTE